MSETRVDLPLPVLPTIAVTVPGMHRIETFDRTGVSAPGYVNPAPPNSTTPYGLVGRRGWAGAGTVASVSSTSVMRSAHTAARGITTANMVAMTTDIRICMT